MYKVFLLSLLSVLPISHTFAANTSNNADVNAFLNEIHEDPKKEVSVPSSLMYDNYNGRSTGRSQSSGNTPSIASEIKEQNADSTASSLMYEKF